MNLQEMLGDAYKDGMSIDEINTALSGKKFADLSTGKYVDVNKYNNDVQSKTNELNELQKQLSAKMTDDEKAAASIAADKARITELENLLKSQTVSSNRDRVQSLTSDIRTILDVKDDDASYNGLLDTLSKDETENARSLATYINKIVKDSYDKGKKDATKDNLGNFSNGVGKQGSAKEDEIGSFGKSLASASKPSVSADLFFGKK